ncbi:thyroid receptor-interacting protein 11 [Anopheles nili]|uniref:thyroid receptor-interacting protein 11 n=1 Tax=Anopheles nili TaxID=185578 RepID=UPI00237B57B3|nr:thyroid receptor-interacting protein 11 [Anopheles nili]
MSWLKLNDSLNKVKGSITSFTQEVFAEGIITEDEINQNPARELSITREKIHELTELCATQDQEIATLRKQVAEYQQQLQQPSSSSSTPQPGPSSSSKPPPGASGSEHHAGTTTVTSTLEDSWFWDPDNNISSTSSSSKKDDNDSPSSGPTELTTIPLEAPASESEIIERLHRQLNEKLQQLKKQQLENALLNEKLGQVSRENRELNENIEELDRQHEVVLENLLTSKRDLQAQCGRLEAEMKRQATEAEASLQDLRTRFERLEHSYADSCQENAKLQSDADRLRAELEQIVCENVEAVAALEHQLEEMRLGRDSSQKESQTLRQELEELRQRSNEEAEVMVAMPSNQAAADLPDASSNVAQLQVELDDLKQTLEDVRTERDNLQKLTAELDRSEHIGQLEREIGELQNELRSVIIDNSVQLEALEKESDDKLAALRQENQALREATTVKPEPNARVAELIRGFFELELSQADELAERFRQSRDATEKLSALERKLMDAGKEFDFLKSENSRIQHDKDTLTADLMQYEKECASLMKNNDRLLEELENVKCNKLETINENAEDSIVVLEKQLEDTHRLNRTLEDEYRESHRKLEEVLEEKEELLMQVATLEGTVADGKTRVRQLEQTLVEHSTERDKLAGQLEELRLAGGQETEQLRAELHSVQGQLTTINEDHAGLVRKLQQLQQSSSDNIRTWESKIEQMRLLLEEKESDLQQAREAGTVSTEQSTEIEQYRTEIEQHRAKIEQQQEALERLTKQKDDLVQLVTTKHNESVQYHAEIQRLNQLLQAETDREVPPCTVCPSLREKLQDYERLTDQIQFLREKSDILTANLMTEQNNQRMALQQKQELLEQRDALQRDLERLRQHLLETEETHTQETVELQRRYDDTRQQLTTLEREVKQSTNALTSASIRANQQAETLQAQYQLLLQQRDELNVRLSVADDRDQRNQAALTNLQCALEQFQMNRERDIEVATGGIRGELEAARAREDAHKENLKQIQQQLADAKTGLLAAARISDQLEISQVTVASLKAELVKRDERYEALERRLQDTEASQADKVEKTLVKNLIIGYAVAPNASDKQQIMKLISSVLTMDQTECTKVGLHHHRAGPGGAGGWFNSILGGAPGAESVGANYNKESLTEAFVKFLEKESAPRATASSSLLNIVTAPQVAGASEDLQPQQPGTAGTGTGTTTTGSGGNLLVTVPPALVPQPILVPEAMMLQQQPGFAPPRSSSSILKDILSDS